MGEKIFFVTSADLPFFPGRGGTEAFVFSHIRELRRRGFDARLATVGLQAPDGRSQVPDIPFVDVAHEQALSKIEATLIGVCKPFTVPTKKPGFIMVHVPPISCAYNITDYKTALRHHKLIANSHFTREKWATAIGIAATDIAVVYPFADPAFAATARSKPSDITRVLFAGRLHISKGIYLFLEALHHPELQHNYTFTVLNAGQSSADSKIIMRLLEAHPRIHTAKERTTPHGMAELLAVHDIVVVPSNHHFWHEAFGMIAVEAQHAGSRVVATGAGGLPETEAGALHLFEPGNSQALARAIEKARLAGPITPSTRQKIAQTYTLAQSVDSLLQALHTKP